MIVPSTSAEPPSAVLGARATPRASAPARPDPRPDINIILRSEAPEHVLTPSERAYQQES